VASHPASVLQPAVAGTWYPAKPDDLASLVDDLLSGPDPAPVQPGARALVAPHAGFEYSGRVAGLGFRCLPPETNRVLLVGPSHHARFDGATVPEASAYRTPLGDVPVDVDAVDRIAGSPAVRRDDRPFRPEHSLEAELPFLQRHLRPGWGLVPVLIGTVEIPALRRVSQALAPVFDEGTLAVISSDFTHYGTRFGYVPFVDRVEERIRSLDQAAIARMVAIDKDGFRRHVEETGATICGRAAIEVLLQLLDTRCSGRLVAYDTSGRLTGDFRHSVSYAAILFC